MIHTLAGVPGTNYFGRLVAGGVDFDGDTYPDVLVGDPHELNKRGAVHVFSGRTGRLMRKLLGRVAGEHFGAGHEAMVPVGDVNRDGSQDLLVCAVGRAANGIEGGVDLISWKTLPLAADCHVLSAKVGGTCAMRLDAGLPHAGSMYRLVGSFTGTEPGLPLLGVKIPLNFDLYFQLAAVSVNPFIPGSWGFLDAKGQAVATMKFPAIPAAAGFTLHHAYVVFNKRFTGLSLASNAVPLRFVK